MALRTEHRLFLVSALALFIELALIRWLGSEVRVFSYFKNLILIAAFLGFGLGFFRARSPLRLDLSVAVLVAIVVSVAVPAWIGRPAYGPQVASVGLSNFGGSIFMGDEQVLRFRDVRSLLLGLAWTVALFMATLTTLYGYAQQLGRDIDDLGQDRLLAAYSWNVGGSLVGILGFSLVSRLALPPLVWFALPVAATIPLLAGRTRRGLGALGTVALIVFLWPQPRTVWSPYQKLTWSDDAVVVNGVGYMSIRSFAERRTAKEQRGVDRFRLPHTLRPGAKRVLIVGAGAGNDVSVALRAGAERVVAVEIDPEIYAIGKRLHPDRPYADARVSVVLDDARHYAETSQEQFDLIVLSHPDSHTALSSFTNVRLDNYIHTTDSYRTFSRLLAPGGAFYVSFWATREWIGGRLAENLHRAFGAPPVELVRLARVRGQRGPRSLVWVTHFVASADPAVRARAARLRAAEAEFRDEDLPRALPSTDDWPYLFVAGRSVPVPMLLLAGLLLVVCGATIGAFLRSSLRGGGRWPIDRHFFFLGAAFLLVEVHNVSKLARVFGTTWSVNAWVITGILGVILLANALTTRWPARFGGPVSYGLLLGCLLAGVLVPIERVLALPGGAFLLTAVYTAPLLFAGLIFAQSFQRAADPLRALGSNILGSLVGGFLELASFTFGLASLLLIAGGLYLLSLRRPAPEREPPTEPVGA